MCHKRLIFWIMKLIDNINHKLGDELTKTIGKGRKLSIAWLVSLPN